MAHLDIDFGIPMALLAASIVGVMIVRFAAARGERAAKERARRWIEELGLEGTGVGAGTTARKGGMRERESASTD